MAEVVFDRRSIFPGALIVLTGLAVYANSLHGPFLFDDLLSTVGNPTIRSWATAFTPPHGAGLTVEGRPLLNASFALNWALSGEGTGSYHALNLLIHVAAALALWGIVRRHLGEWFAVAVALLWVAHPLQTESVTYVVQRAESLMGLFYLLTLYCFVRSVESDRSAAWSTAAVACCYLGMAVKEPMVSAPLAVLLHDRAFVAGSWRAAWTRRKGFYVALFSSWLLLVALVLGTGNRGHTSGFGSGVGVFQYWLTQPGAILHYLRLVFLPWPLVFDYGTQWVVNPWSALLPAILLVLLAGTSLVGVVQNRRWAVPAFLFFAVLAPTSVIPGNRQTSAEHRMYLPLAAVLVLVAGGAAALARTDGRRRAVAVGLALCAVPLGIAASVRNRDYQQAFILYRDSAQKLPDNAFARYNLGRTLYDAGSFREALAEYQAAVRLDPTMGNAYNNLGNTLRDLGQGPAAEAAYRSAIRLSPTEEKAWYNLGVILLQQGRKPEAVEAFQGAIRLNPRDGEARDNLGGVLLDLGHPREAEEQFLAVVALSGGSVETHYNLGMAYLLQNRTAEARAEFSACLRMRPGFPPAQARLDQL